MKLVDWAIVKEEKKLRTANFIRSTSLSIATLKLPLIIYWTLEPRLQEKQITQFRVNWLQNVHLPSNKKISWIILNLTQLRREKEHQKSTQIVNDFKWKVHLKQSEQQKKIRFSHRKKSIAKTSNLSSKLSTHWGWKG